MIFLVTAAVRRLSTTATTTTTTTLRTSPYYSCSKYNLSSQRILAVAVANYNNNNNNNNSLVRHGSTISNSNSNSSSIKNNSSISISIINSNSNSKSSGCHCQVLGNSRFAFSTDGSSSSSSPSSIISGGNTKSPREKLHDIIENYRQVNYSQETFARFIKEIVKAADENKDGMISVLEVEHLLSNIGAHDALTPVEIKSIMEELGCINYLTTTTTTTTTSDEDAATVIPATRLVDFFHLQSPTKPTSTSS